MALELSDVKRIANLARIEVSDGEAAQTLTQLNQFFTLVEQMQAVDTTGIEPMAHPIELIQAPAQRLRDDATAAPTTSSAPRPPRPACTSCPR